MIRFGVEFFMVSVYIFRFIEFGFDVIGSKVGE